MAEREAVSISEAEAVAHLRLALQLSGIEVDEVALPISRQLRLRDLDFHYLDWGGPDDAPAVVLLHGGGLNAHTWDVICLALRKRYRCVALDQRGHGDTQWSGAGAYGRDDHVGDIQSFVSELSLARPVIVGMSLGGLNTMAYAAGRQDLAGVVLVDVGPEFQSGPVGHLIDFMAKGIEPTSREDFIERALRFNHRRNRQLLEISVLRNIRQHSGGGWTWKYDPRAAITGNPAELREANLTLWSAVAKITCPVLVVRGAESPVFTQEQAEELVARLADAHLEVVEGAGHTVQGDNPAGLLRALEPFLDRVFRG
jgi:pimeloyl-ACP methyl ester carboxylesterase